MTTTRDVRNWSPAPQSGTARPRVGITMFSGREGHKVYTKLQYNYVQSIIDAGGLPVLIPTSQGDQLVYPYVNSIDGLMLTGGEDVNPLVYGGEPRPELGDTDLERDRFELALVSAAESRGIPIFGICRGLQIMNVYRGGSLYQDLVAETGTTIGHAPFHLPMESRHHSIQITEGTRLHTIFRQPELVVNSFHHQAVKDVGKGLLVTARAPDGIVEGMEDPDLDFFLGVQFHAEAMPPLDPYYLTVFTAFVEAIAAV